MWSRYRQLMQRIPALVLYLRLAAAFATPLRPSEVTNAKAQGPPPATHAGREHTRGHAGEPSVGPPGLITSAGFSDGSFFGLGKVGGHPPLSPPPQLELLNITEFASAVKGAPQTGPDNFGDIMGGGETARSILHHFSPLERIVLTANGNLQRVISSFYDAPVTVAIIFCNEMGVSGVYDRKVQLSVGGQVFCTAKSCVILHSSVCMEAVHKGQVGIGQLFRYLDVLPRFQLLNAGRTLTGGFWRVYDLRSEHLSCRIHEEYPPDLFQLQLQVDGGAKPLS